MGGSAPSQPGGEAPSWVPIGGPPPWGPAGSPPPWGPMGAAWPPQPPPRRRGRRILTYVVVAALAASAGAGAVFALHPGSSQSANTTGISTAQIPQPNRNAAPGTTKVNPTAVAAKVEPGIVDINTVIAEQNIPAAGTGMVLSANGLVLTNNHVVEDGTHLTATVVTDGHKYPVKVIGVDPTQDVALIQLQGASHLRTIQVGDSAKVTLGTAVVVVGNAGGKGGTPTVSNGAITSLDRTITASDGGNGANSETLHGMLQTNAPIQPGDSGGAWANSAGQVVGMTTAANSQSLGGAGTSQGFAIPIDRALSIARQIASGHAQGGVLIGTSGIMGVGVSDISQAAACLSGGGFGGGGPTGTAPAKSGALVCSAYPGTPAAKAGLAAGDVITSVNGQSVASANSLSTIMRRYRPGNTVSVTWLDTSGQKHTAPLTLVAGPPK